MGILGKGGSVIKAAKQVQKDLTSLSSLSKLTNQTTSTAAGNDVSNGDLGILKGLYNEQSIATLSLMTKYARVDNFSSSGMGLNWNKNFPYRFIIINAENSNEIVASYRLPINPQDISINSPFASKLTITSGGVLEEHNGIPLKQITINGTTGIYLGRETYNIGSARTSVVGTIFGNTIDAAQGAASALRNTLSQSVTAPSALGTPTPEPEADSPSLKRTGYYQYHILRLFLETYAELKKKGDGNKYRLVFEMAKDNLAYYVTPNNFTSRRSTASPLEYLYTIQLTAWGSIDLTSTPSNLLGPSGIIARDIGTTRRLFNALKGLRTTVGKFKNIVSVARADVESNIFGPISDVILLTKDILSIPQTIADFPKSLRDSFQTSVIANWDLLSRSNPELKTKFNDTIQTIKNDISGSNSANPFLESNVDGNQDIYNQDVLDTLELTDAVTIDQLQLTDNQQTAVNETVNNALSINTNDINDLIIELQDLSDGLEPIITSKPPLDEEWDLLFSIQETIGNLKASTATNSLNNSANEDSDANDSYIQSNTALAFWQGATANAGIAYNSPESKFAVPFPFRSTLEQIAAQYLGDALRWPEIASLNGLQHPYVDEDGFTYNFIANGTANSFNIETNENLYVDQIIYLMSSTQNTSKRKILAINKISNTNYQIVVDGDRNVNLYDTADQAKMRAYLPYTTNSMRDIYIPAPVNADNTDLETKALTFLQDDPDFIKFTKIDLLLDSKGDLAFADDGFLNLAYGKTNLVQAANLKVTTVVNSLLLSPGYGAGVEPGESTADIDLETIINNINNSFSNDPRFLAPSSIQLRLDGDALVMDILASIRSGNGILPITLPLSE